MKSKVIDTLETKQTHQVFELYVKEELNLKILEKSNSYASQKNSLLDLTMLDLIRSMQSCYLQGIILYHKQERFGRKKMMCEFQ